MLKTVRSAVVASIVLTLPGLAAAQDKPQPDQGQQGGQQQQGQQPQGQPAQGQQQQDQQQGTAASDAAAAQHTAIPGTPDLTVATVRAQGGHRTSKIVGAAVYNGGNQQIGTVDDVILNDDGKAVLAIIAVGGFLGVGSKLVAEPYSALKFDGSGKVLLPDGSKESLNGMPAFTYTQ